MKLFILNVILWTLALYGFFDIIKSLIRTYFHPKISSNGVYLIIAVKNQENKIEGFIRSFIFKLIYSNDEDIDNIIVVDLNSTDSTADILNILANDYKYIKFTDLNNCKNMLDNISNKE